MKRAIFVSSHDETTLYVKAKYSGIPLLVQLIDGLPLVFFGKQKTAYLEVSTVLEWYRKEIAVLSPCKERTNYEEFLRLMEGHQQAFENQVRTQQQREMEPS